MENINELTLSELSKAWIDGTITYEEYQHMTWFYFQSMQVYRRQAHEA